MGKSKVPWIIISAPIFDIEKSEQEDTDELLREKLEAMSKEELVEVLMNNVEASYENK